MNSLTSSYILAICRRRMEMRAAGKFQKASAKCLCTGSSKDQNKTNMNRTWMCLGRRGWEGGRVEEAGPLKCEAGWVIWERRPEQGFLLDWSKTRGLHSVLFKTAPPKAQTNRCKANP